MSGKINGVNYGNPCESISGLWILIYFDETFDERNTMYDWAKYLSFLWPKETMPYSFSPWNLFNTFLLTPRGLFIPFFPTIPSRFFFFPLSNFLHINLASHTFHFNSFHFRMTITASCVLKLHNFPLDSQKCHLEIGSCKYLSCQYDSVTTNGNLNSTWNVFPQEF